MELTLLNLLVAVVFLVIEVCIVRAAFPKSK